MNDERYRGKSAQVTCPYCGAEANEACVSQYTGHTTRAHKERAEYARTGEVNPAWRSLYVRGATR